MILALYIFATVWLMTGLALGVRYILQSPTWEDGRMTTGQIAGFLLLTAVAGFPVLAGAMLTMAIIYVVAVLTSTVSTYRTKK